MSLGKKYYTGVVWQDFQHQQLLDLLYKVKKAKIDKGGPEVFRYSIAFLAMYVNHHFKLEEEYMDIYYYPDIKSHKKEHKDYVKRIKLIREKFKEYNDEVIDKLLLTLNKWILDHILGNDIKLGEYILKAEQKTK